MMEVKKKIKDPYVDSPDAPSVVFELLQACVRPSQDSECRARIAAGCDAGVDWEHFWKLASHHKVIPLVFANLRAACPAALPADQVQALEQFVQNVKARNRFLLVELRKIQELLQKEGIPALSFKGPVLTRDVYGQLTLRSSTDLDVLIPPNAAAAVDACLQQNGYTPHGESESPTRRRLRRRIHGQLAYVRGAMVFVLDVHSRFLPPLYVFNPDFDELWSRSEDVALNGANYRTLAPEDCLLFLCHHGIKNRWERLTYISDVAHFMHTYRDLDWERVLHRARTLEGERALCLGVYLAHRVLGGDFPRAIEGAVASRTHVPAAADQIIERLYRFLEIGMAPLTERARLHLTMQDTWRARAQYVSMAAARYVADELLGV